MEKNYRLIKDKNARAFLGSQAFSFIGSGAMPIALSFALLDHGFSALSVGGVLAATDLPFVLLLLVGGVIADRFSRKAVAISSEVVRALLALVLAYIVIWVTFTPLELAIVGAGWGVARAFYAPTLTGMTPEIFTQDALVAANSFREGARAIGNLGGPALAGFGVAYLGAGKTILIIAVCYAISGLWLSKVSGTIAPDVVERSFLEDLKTGYREVRSQTWCWLTIIVYSFMHLLVFGPLVVLGPLIAKRHLGGAATWGVILAFEGVGGILGAVAASRFKLKRPLWSASIIALLGSPSFFLLALRVSPIFIAPSVAMLGFGFSFVGINWETTIQRFFPQEAMSRVSAYDIFGSVALYPLGQVLGGLETHFMSASLATIACGIALIATSLILIGSKSVYRLKST